MGTRFPITVFEYRRKIGGIRRPIPAHTTAMKILASFMKMIEKGSYSIHRFFYPERHFIVYKGDTAVAMTMYEKNAFKIFNELVEEQNGSSKSQRLRRPE
jgi:hypothetical protein